MRTHTTHDVHMTPSQPQSGPQRDGFTLMEVLLVLAIMGLIMSMVIPKIMGRQKYANEDATRLSLHGLKQALRIYSMDHGGRYPSASEGLDVLRTPPSRKDPRWRGPYLEQEPLDAWGTPLIYTTPGRVNRDAFDLSSAGEDQVAGTDDDVTL